MKTINQYINEKLIVNNTIQDNTKKVEELYNKIINSNNSLVLLNPVITFEILLNKLNKTDKETCEAMFLKKTKGRRSSSPFFQFYNNNNYKKLFTVNEKELLRLLKDKESIWTSTCYGWGLVKHIE